MILAGTGMMVYTSTHLALVGLCIVPCVAGMAVVYGRYVRNITKTLNDQFADVMKVAEERLGNVRTVKIFCKEDYENRLFGDKLKTALDIGYREVKARAGFYGMVGSSSRVLVWSFFFHFL
jgi:ATP-binding cassette, subfamily B (MDR/TAP), member 10